MAIDRKLEDKTTHTVAILVDVDKTLLLGQDGYYNVDLINALKATGHHKIYLFTSMTNGEIVNEIANGSLHSSRPKLVEYLKKNGIEVLDVMTPADVIYDKGIGAAYKDFFLKHHNRIDKELTQDTFRTDESFQKDSKQYSDSHEEACRCEAPFTGKSRLYQYGVAHLPEVGSYIVIDDSKQDLFAISAVKNKDIMDPTCVIVNKDSNQEYFERKIASHYIEKVLLHTLQEQKPDQNILDRCAFALNKFAHVAFEDKNYDAAAKYFELIYLMSRVVKLSGLNQINLLENIKKTNDLANAKSSSSQHFDNLSVDVLYTNILKLNPFQMEFGRLQLKTELFKISNSQKYFPSMGLLFSQYREKDYKEAILNPFQAFMYRYPIKNEECLELFKKIQAYIPHEQYKKGIDLLKTIAIESMTAKLKIG